MEINDQEIMRMAAELTAARVTETILKDNAWLVQIQNGVITRLAATASKDPQWLGAISTVIAMAEIKFKEVADKSVQAAATRLDSLIKSAEADATSRVRGNFESRLSAILAKLPEVSRRRLQDALVVALKDTLKDRIEVLIRGVVPGEPVTSDRVIPGTSR